MQTLQPNTHLQGGRYRIERMLGQGSFGITYLAEHTNLGKKVAIKEFFMKELNSRAEDGSITGMSDGSLSLNYFNKFKKEAINLSRLDHPNIVRVTDSFGENGTFYYVMDFIEGPNLNDYVKQHHVDAGEAIDIICSVADALIYMHEQKQMLHLDLKPSNVMRRASDGHIFLIDFGLSKHYSEDGIPDTSTNIGLGTAGYAPIEQGNKSKDGEFRPTIDVYALGATFYKLLTGETPPEASYLVEDEESLSDNLKAKGVSDDMVAVVEKAMSPSVKKRYQSIRELKNALIAVDEGGQSPVYSNEESEQTDDTIVPGTDETITPRTGNPRNPGECSNSGTNDTSNFVRTSPKPRRRNRKGILNDLIVIVVIMAVMGGGAYIINSGLKNQTTYAYYSNGVLTVNGYITYEMVKVEAGTFTMGATSEMVDYGFFDEFYADEKPTHQVTLTKDYYMGKTEVTQALWKAVMGSNPSNFKGDNRPVENVSWKACQRFISKLNSMTGKKFRLPTEAEWEFAARGGNWTKGYQYSGSNSLNDVAWFTDNSGSTTHDVATKQPNELGLYDMSGNVWEWCADWDGSYSSNAQYDPVGPSSGSCRVRRGGGWYVYASRCRSSNRHDEFPVYWHNFLGLRLVLSEE